MEPIAAFVGMNGSGKTLALVHQAVLPAIQKGMGVLSNMPIFASADDVHLPTDERKLHPAFTPLESWRQIDGNLRGHIVVLDEVSSMFDSRDSGKVPTQLVTRLQQLRKGDNAVVWSAPDWDRADKVLRRVTLGVTMCRGFLPVQVEGRIWRSNRLFRWRHYNGLKFEEFSAASAQSDKKNSLRCDRSAWHWRAKHASQALYDTYADVGLLDHLDQYGSCIDCGGTRRRPACSCK